MATAEKARQRSPAHSASAAWPRVLLTACKKLCSELDWAMLSSPCGDLQAHEVRRFLRLCISSEFRGFRRVPIAALSAMTRISRRHAIILGANVSADVARRLTPLIRDIERDRISAVRVRRRAAPPGDSRDRALRVLHCRGGTGPRERATKSADTQRAAGGGVAIGGAGFFVGRPRTDYGTLSLRFPECGDGRDRSTDHILWRVNANLRRKGTGRKRDRFSSMHVAYLSNVLPF